MELVHVVTEDGIRLHGAFEIPPEEPTEPTEPEAPGRNIDVFLCIHGSGGNFYSSPPFTQLVPRFLTAGYKVLRVNTRGHDVVSSVSTVQGRRLGTAYERVEESGRDLAAWLEFLHARGLKRVAIVGHSLGAVKSLYWTAQCLPDVSALICLSPPRLSYSFLSQGKDGERLAETVALAQAEAQKHGPDHLIEVDFPFRYLTSVGSYLEKYGPDERCDILRQLPAVPCPMLLIFGTMELRDHPAFHHILDQIGALKLRATVECQTVPGANHLYGGKCGQLQEIIQNWLLRLPGEIEPGSNHTLS